MTLYSRRDRVPMTPHGASVRVEGIEETLRILERLELNLVRRVTTAACRAGAAVLLKLARAEAPKETGMLAKQLRQSTKYNRTTGTVTARIWPKPTNMQRARGHVHRGSVVHLVVEGTKPHIIPGPLKFNGRWYSNVKHPGARKNPFIDRAADRGRITAVAAFAKRFKDKADQEIAKVKQ